MEISVIDLELELIKTIKDFEKELLQKYNRRITVKFETLINADKIFDEILQSAESILQTFKDCPDKLIYKSRKEIFVILKHSCIKLMYDIGLSKNYLAKKFNLDRSSVKYIIEHLEFIWDTQKEYEESYFKILNKLKEDGRINQCFNKERINT